MNQALSEQMARTFVVVLSPLCIGFLLLACWRGWKWLQRMGGTNS